MEAPPPRPLPLTHGSTSAFVLSWGGFHVRVWTPPCLMVTAARSPPCGCVAAYAAVLGDSVTTTQSRAPARDVSSGVTWHVFWGTCLKGAFHVRLPHFAMLGDVSETAAPQTPFTSLPSDGNGGTPCISQWGAAPWRERA